MENNILNLLKNLYGDDATVEKLDLTNEKDNKRFKELVAQLPDNEIFKPLAQLFGFDVDELVEKLNDIANKSLPKKEEKIKRPSQQIPTEAGLQIHKLVSEYVDTMIKPYLAPNADKNVVNDAYAGLYEFACWIYNKKK